MAVKICIDASLDRPLEPFPTPEKASGGAGCDSKVQARKLVWFQVRCCLRGAALNPDRRASWSRFGYGFALSVTVLTALRLQPRHLEETGNVLCTRTASSYLGPWSRMLCMRVPEEAQTGESSFSGGVWFR